MKERRKYPRATDADLKDRSWVQIAFGNQIDNNGKVGFTLTSKLPAGDRDDYAMALMLGALAAEAAWHGGRLKAVVDPHREQLQKAIKSADDDPGGLFFSNIGGPGT